MPPSVIMQSVTNVTTPEFMQDLVDWAGLQGATSGKFIIMFFFSRTQNLYKTLSISELALQDAGIMQSVILSFIHQTRVYARC